MNCELELKMVTIICGGLPCNLNNYRSKLKMVIVLDGKPILKTAWSCFMHVSCRFIEIEWVIQGSLRMINCVYIVGCFALCESIPLCELGQQ